MTKRRNTKRLADGTLLTPAETSRILTEVETAIDAGDVFISYPRRGRPSLNGGATASPHVGFRLSPELKSKAEQLARLRGISVSELARQALEVMVANASR